MIQQCTETLINLDRNGDAALSISDVWFILRDIATLPYRLIHDALIDTPLYVFFEMSPESCDSQTALTIGLLSVPVIGFLLIGVVVGIDLFWNGR